MTGERTPPRPVRPPETWEDKRNPWVDAREHSDVVTLDAGQDYDIRLLSFREVAEQRHVRRIAFVPIRCSAEDWQTLQIVGVLGLRIGGAPRVTETPVWWMLAHDFDPPFVIQQGELCSVELRLAVPLREAAVIGVGVEGVRRMHLPK